MKTNRLRTDRAVRVYGGGRWACTGKQDARHAAARRVTEETVTGCRMGCRSPPVRRVPSSTAVGTDLDRGKR